MFGYGEDVRDWADRILDDAPPVPASAWVVRAATVLTPELRPDSLLAMLLAEDGEFTAEIAAKRYDCWPSSVRGTLRNYPEHFVQVRPRHGYTPAVWRTKREGE